MTPDTDDSETIALHHEIKTNDSAFNAAMEIWDLLRNAYTADHLTTTPDKIDLYVEINGHQNDKGGFSSEMFLLQKQLFINVLPPFVNEITFPLGNINVEDTGLETFLKENVEEAVENPNQEIYQDDLEDFPPIREFVKEMQLVASYHEESDSLLWLFGKKDNLNQLTANLAQKEIELEA